MRIQLDVPESILHALLDGVALPRMALIHYELPTPSALANVERATREETAAAAVASGITAGERVAIGVGSRGIGRLPEIVRGVVDALRSIGAEPFIVPAMGSHGGATAEGQRDVLSHLGVAPETVHAPVESSMDTVVVGVTADGMPVHIDRLAMAADRIAFVARIKPHTAFRGAYESGLAKMIAIGLGKQVGAAQTHARGFGTMADMVPAMAAVALRHAPIAFGLAVLENAHDEPFLIRAIPAERILQEEPALLERARAAMPRLPFAELDVLVIDRIGKNISGDGADPNITGRYPTPYASGGPSINKQVILDLDVASAGNANGMGTGDFVTARLASKVDLGMTYPNALTSTVAGPVALPMILPSDRLAIAAAIQTCNAVEREPRVVRVRDTLHLERLYISESLVAEAEARTDIAMMEPPTEMAFDDAGNLPITTAGFHPAPSPFAAADVW